MEINNCLLYILKFKSSFFFKDFEKIWKSTYRCITFYEFYMLKFHISREKFGGRLILEYKQKYSNRYPTLKILSSWSNVSFMPGNVAVPAIISVNIQPTPLQYMCTYINTYIHCTYIHNVLTCQCS
jgi:hypothetical protein